MKYKIGDRVRVRQNEKKIFKFVTIKGQVTDCGYVVKESATVYTDEMLDGLYEEPIDYGSVSALEFLDKAKNVCKANDEACGICDLEGNCIFNYTLGVDDISLKNAIKATMEVDSPKQSILTDSEREYLSAVIKPFRDDVRCICKYASDISSKCWLAIKVEDEQISFPSFEPSKYFRGMKVRKKYTVDELCL